MFGFYDHEICPDTGRPLSHDSWLREAVLIWGGFATCAFLMTGAAYDFAQYGWDGRALELLGFIGVAGLLTLV